MNNPLEQYPTFILKEHVGFLKINNTYDLIDPETGNIFAKAEEENSTLFKILSLVNPGIFPTSLVVRDSATQTPFMTMKKGFSFLRSRLDIYNADQLYIGYLQSKVLTIGGAFRIFDNHDNEVAEVKGDWKGFNFTVRLSDGQEVGKIAKQWGGIGKELLTTADTYVISINEELQQFKTLLLAGCLAIDTVFKEESK
jgi:uncharacterized protein YxjI